MNAKRNQQVSQILTSLFFHANSRRLAKQRRKSWRDMFYQMRSAFLCAKEALQVLEADNESLRRELVPKDGVQRHWFGKPE